MRESLGRIEKKLDEINGRIKQILAAIEAVPDATVKLLDIRDLDRCRNRINDIFGFISRAMEKYRRPPATEPGDVAAIRKATDDVDFVSGELAFWAGKVLKALKEVYYPKIPGRGEIIPFAKVRMPMSALHLAALGYQDSFSAFTLGSRSAGISTIAPITQHRQILKLVQGVENEFNALYDHTATPAKALAADDLLPSNAPV